MHPTILAFKAAVEAGDRTAAFACLHDDVTFNSPVVFRPYRGRAETEFVLTGAFHVFDGTLRYEHTVEGTAGDDHLGGLVFRAEVDGREIHGWDFIRVGSDGLIIEFTVMLRPMSAVHTMAEAMQRMLDQLGTDATTP